GEDWLGEVDGSVSAPRCPPAPSCRRSRSATRRRYRARCRAERTRRRHRCVAAPFVVAFEDASEGKEVLDGVAAPAGAAPRTGSALTYRRSLRREMGDSLMTVRR